MSMWSDIRCDYLDEENYFWTVDAWITDDDNEEGKVIAHIDDLTGRVVYNDPLARIDEYAQEIIKNKVKEIKGEDIKMNTLDIDGVVTWKTSKTTVDEAIDECFEALVATGIPLDIVVNYYSRLLDENGNEIDS